MGIDKEKSLVTTSDKLRCIAEERLSAKNIAAESSITDEESRKLLHELQVHQIELEMQNEELRQTRDDLDVALEKFTDLFDFAPVSYFHLDRSGAIRTVKDEIIEQIMNLIMHMSRTIDDFRNFSRPDREMKQYDLKETLIKTLILVGDGFKAQNIQVDMHAQEDLVVTGYPNEYSQVLLIILNNARDVLTERNVASPRIEINLFREGGSTVATISDNAGGIPDEIIDRIFDPYFTTKDAEKGSGIGLYMSKAILEKRLNGKISVRNNDQGAEFRIEV